MKREADITRVGFVVWMSDLIVLLALLLLRLTVSRNGASTLAVAVLILALLPVMWVSGSRRHPTRIAIAFTAMTIGAWFLPWEPTRPLLGY